MKPSILFLALIICSTIRADINNGLVAYYPFNGNADDVSGNNLHGVVFEATLTSDRFSIPNRAYLFDGFDDFIEVQNRNGIFDLTTSWTLSTWTKPFDPGTDERNDPIIWKLAENGTERDTFMLGWGGRSLYGPNPNIFVTGLEQASDDYDYKFGSLQQASNEWHHVVGIYDGTSVIIYVDGIINASANIGPVMAYTGSAPLRIGNILNSTHGVPESYRGAFNGIVDDVRIYDRALSPEEVSQLYTVPEPASLLLLAFGGLLIRKR